MLANHLPLVGRSKRNAFRVGAMTQYCPPPGQFFASLKILRPPHKGEVDCRSAHHGEDVGDLQAVGVAGIAGDVDQDVVVYGVGPVPVHVFDQLSLPVQRAVGEGDDLRAPGLQIGAVQRDGRAVFG